jgi:ribonuclease Z
LVNGIDGDPGLYVQLIKSGSAVLFDCGTLDRIAARDILRIKWVFVSHTHVDHFIGFDRIIRVNIPHFRKVQVVGPAGIASNISGKLRGYHWNLLAPEQVVYEVSEVLSHSEVARYHVSSSDDFVPRLLAHGQSTSVDFELDDGSRVTPAILDHGTPCLAFKLTAPVRWKFDRERMADLGLAEGPWIRELQQSASLPMPADASINIDGKLFQIAELIHKLLTEMAQPSIGYITDIGFSRSNVEVLSERFDRLDALWCESCFSNADRKRATNTKHLTAQQSALIGQVLKVRSFFPFHISGIYGDQVESVHQEALDFHKSFSVHDSNQLQDSLESEFEAAELY